MHTHPCCVRSCARSGVPPLLLGARAFRSWCKTGIPAWMTGLGGLSRTLPRRTLSASMLILQDIWCSTLSGAHPTNELFTGGSYAGYLVTSVDGATICHYATGSYALGPRLSPPKAVGSWLLGLFRLPRGWVAVMPTSRSLLDFGNAPLLGIKGVRMHDE